MGGLCFRQQLTCEDSTKLPNLQTEETLPAAEIPIKDNLTSKSKRKKFSQPIATLKSIQKTPDIINTVTEHQNMKKIKKSSTKSTSFKKSTQKKPRKNNFLKRIEPELTKEELKVSERKSSPTTTAAYSERPESRHELHKEEDYLKDIDTEITESSIFFLQHKEQFLNTSNKYHSLNKKRNMKERQFLPFMRKLHCEIASIAHITNSYCEEILLICNKIQAQIDSILQSVNKSKLINNLVDAYTIIYGSMATKLGYEHSDLDLAIRGFTVKTGYELKEYMNWLNEKLSSLASSSCIIHTARVPLITAVLLYVYP